jgi:hypothetical protein
MSPLHTAARELISDAPEATIRVILRLLLDDKPRTERTARPARPARAIRRKRKRRAKAAPVISQEWEDLRHRVRGQMRQRGIDYPKLAEAVGVSASTLRVTLFRHPPPSLRIRDGLRGWLERPAPEVAATPPAPFRGPAPASNGTRATSAPA